MKFLQAHTIGKLRQDKWVVKDIAIDLPPLRKLAIAGETGSGKSTLLQMLGGIVNPDKGNVYFEEQRIKRIPEEKLLPGHPGIAYLSQQFDIPHHMRVEEALEATNKLEPGTEHKLYQLCQIDHLLKRKTDQLSGGERQRIALARLLNTSPKLLLLDEPFSNLDPIHKQTLKQVIKDIGEELKMTCILVSHDPLDTVGWADEILVIRDGVQIQYDTPATVYYKPKDEYVAGLFGKYSRISDRLKNVLIEKTQHDLNIDWCVRPNQFVLSKNEEHGIEATITSVYFSGVYYEMEVQVNNESIYVVDTKPWKEGEQIFINITSFPFRLSALPVRVFDP